MRAPFLLLCALAAPLVIGCTSTSDDSAQSDAGGTDDSTDAGSKRDARAPDAGKTVKTDAGPAKAVCVGPSPNGNYCDVGVDSECCSGHCDSTSEACCSAATQACSLDGDCCTGTHCGGVGSTCCADPGPASYCTSTSECCAQESCGSVLVGDDFNKFTAQDHACCIAPSDSCTTSDQCCTGAGGGGVQCYEGTCCLSAGVACAKNEDCCDGTCSSGMCN